ncbi:hypothetical protein [Burkholderia orbicola]|uniref:hypothetical protein n=1 Tax=Burkholderia orbicola TaxID=2978683 RepID=UPI003AF65A05
MDRTQSGCAWCKWLRLITSGHHHAAVVGIAILIIQLIAVGEGVLWRMVSVIGGGLVVLAVVIELLILAGWVDDEDGVNLRDRVSLRTVTAEAGEKGSSKSEGES